MKLKQKAVLLISRTKTGKKAVASQRYRIILSAAVSLVFNLLYAIYNCVLGILNLSFWFVAMCAFYGILATMRFCVVMCERGHQKSPADDTERFVMKFSGALLLVLGGVLAAVNYISLSQNIAAKHEEIIMITIATYTFCKITVILTGELWTYLADLNEQAQERLDTIMEQMKATEGVTEELKRTCQMEWVQRCNNIHNRAEEIVLHEMIYS